MADFVTESIFRASELSYKHESFTKNGIDEVCQSLFLVKLQAFAVNGSERVCDRVCL